NTVYLNGLANGVGGIEKINAMQIKEIEPYCSGIGGLFVPGTGIIDFAVVASKYREVIENKFSSLVITGTTVIGFEKHDDYINVMTTHAKYMAKYVITCAGLQSDRIAKMEGTDIDTA